MSFKEQYPELIDFLTELYNKSESYSDVKEAIQIISEIVNESGINLYDVRELINSAEVHCEELELENVEYVPRLEFITQQCKDMKL
jgi:hypothetical protein